ncbi:PREDICTED: probable respiratory burst oxidase homolog protein I [Tarenaya hassleriana]|uniref:probable respiratory burst oxidase homolog protein I n=1 Tax=Tarenaya hassleriana TaxID=28532 RepID=UPI00053C27BF|nr:PREDICTED: probable respiratory burst oxidase homolog protein I [Tarenaya hassleriana]
MSMPFSFGSRKDRRVSDPDGFAESFSSLPVTDWSGSAEEFLEMTIDLRLGDSFVLRNVEPAVAVEVSGSEPQITSGSAFGSRSRSQSTPPSLRLRELKAVAMAKQFSDDLTARLKEISWRGCGHSTRSAPETVSYGGGIINSAVFSRSLSKRPTKTHHSGSPTERAIRGLRFISSKENGIIIDAWEEVQRKFDELSTDGYLHRSEFARCIGMENSKEFAEELFDALCRRRQSMIAKISRDELYEFWSQITNESFDSRLQIFFDMLNTNGDGRITENEVKEIIMISASASNLSRLRERAEEYAALIMEELASDELPYIEVRQLEILLLEKDISHSYSQSFRTSRALSQNLPDVRWKIPVRRMSRNLLYSLRENWRRIWVLSLWFVIMAGLFTWKCFQYKKKDAYHVMGCCLLMAKGAAETLKFNMAFILLPVCRNTITYLRSTALSNFVPFNDNINFHKIISLAIMLGVILHVSNHLVCDFPRILRSSEDDYRRYLIHYFGSTRPTYVDLVKGPVGVTGLLMVICMIIAFTLASRRCRRNLTRLPKPFDKLTGFNAFWYSHHLLIIVYVLLIVHGVFIYLVQKWYLKTTWMYLAVPCILYSGERVLRFFRSRLYTVQIHKVAIYPGDVVALHMSKPPSFHHKSGQFMFVQCPAVSLFEWHPFSITSAPGDDYLSIHIRQLGDWTKGLKKVFSEACVAHEPGKSGLLRMEGSTNKSLPELLIDGPYGAPAQDYCKYDVLLLIGLGIGATPFISVLRDLLNNIVRQQEQAVNKIPKQQKKKPETNKAYFYWVTREQGSFDWFRNEMNEIADLDQMDVTEMHNYLTSFYEEGEAQSNLITMIQSLNYAKNGVDILSGTKVRTHFGRPKWKKVLTKISDDRTSAARIGVFYCGVPALANELSQLCHEFNQKGSSKFEFHKEQF